MSCMMTDVSINNRSFNKQQIRTDTCKIINVMIMHALFKIAACR